MVRGTLEHNSLSLTLYKFAKEAMDPQKVSPNVMAPSHVNWKITFEFRSAGRQLMQQHSALCCLAGSIITAGSKMGRMPAGIYACLMLHPFFNVNLC